MTHAEVPDLKLAYLAGACSVCYSCNSSLTHKNSVQHHNGSGKLVLTGGMIATLEQNEAEGGGLARQ